MRTTRPLALGTLLVGLCLAAPPLVACGGGGDPKTANVARGEMPEGESWRGVYFHPVYGYLHMEEEGTNVVGRWIRADKSKWGELSGTKSGNVVHFKWKEHSIGGLGATAQKQGKGVFVYKKTEDMATAELDGQYGLEDSEVGADWHNVKQQRMDPDLKSIPGAAGEGSSEWK